jgi:hypothetical protein
MLLASNDKRNLARADYTLSRCNPWLSAEERKAILYQVEAQILDGHENVRALLADAMHEMERDAVEMEKWKESAMAAVRAFEAEQITDGERDAR